MGSIERLNYILNDVESVVGRNALNHKLFNNTLLISITPDSSFSNLSTVSFIYQRSQDDRIQKEYTISNDLFNIHGDDLVTKIIMFADTLKQTDIAKINNYYKDYEKQSEQSTINFFTLGLTNFITLCQLIQDNPSLFSPYNVNLPVKFDVSLLTQSYIEYVDSYLFNIIQGKVSNLVKNLANNSSMFAKYFSKMFNVGTAYDMSKAIQESMKDFKNYTYNPEEIISNHINIIERNKDDLINEMRNEVESYKQEIRDLHINKNDDCCDNIFNKQQDCIAEIDSAQDKVENAISLFKLESEKAFVKLNTLVVTIENRCNDIEDLYNQIQSLSNCNTSQCGSTVDEKMVSDLVNKYLSMAPTKNDDSSSKINDLSKRVDKESARYNNRMSRLEKLFEKILDSMEC